MAWGDPEVGSELRIPACRPHCMQRALTVAPSVPLVKTLFTERMCLYLLCVFREKKNFKFEYQSELNYFSKLCFFRLSLPQFPQPGSLWVDM